MAKRNPGKRKMEAAQDALLVDEFYQSGAISNKLNDDLAVVIEVSPISLSLLAVEGRKHKIAQYHALLRRLRRRVFLLARDVTPDMSAYLDTVAERAREATSTLQHGIVLQIHATLRALIAEQRVREKRFYIILTSTPQMAPASALTLLKGILPGSREDPEIHRQRRITSQIEALLTEARDLIAHLTRIGHHARICGPEEALNLARATYDPYRPPINFGQATRPLTSMEERP